MHEALCCERIEIGMSDYLERALDPALRIRFESHLAVCVDCWRDVQTFRKMGVLLAGIAGTPMPPRMRQTLIEARGRALLVG